MQIDVSLSHPFLQPVFKALACSYDFVPAHGVKAGHESSAVLKGDLMNGIVEKTHWHFPAGLGCMKIWDSIIAVN